MSKKLVKIKEVHLYVGLTEHASECFKAKKILTDAGVKFNLMAYNDETQHQSVFDALNTWSYGPDSKKMVVDKFPIVTWIECFDDFTTHVNYNNVVDVLPTSNLIKNKDLID